MSELFLDMTTFNEDISQWNVSNVTDMSQMFAGATSFNQNIGGWNVSNVTNMSNMFILSDLIKILRMGCFKSNRYAEYVFANAI